MRTNKFVNELLQDDSSRKIRITGYKVHIFRFTSALHRLYDISTLYIYVFDNKLTSELTKCAVDHRSIFFTDSIRNTKITGNV